MTCKAKLAYYTALIVLLLSCHCTAADNTSALPNPTVLPTASTTTIYASVSSSDIVYLEPSATSEVYAAPTATEVIFSQNDSSINYTFSGAYTIDNRDLYTVCWYPISGNYGLLPRVLFYSSLVFALLGRRNEWLIGGALAAALTYSGSAAVHACLLTWRGPGFGELDQQALLGILSVACLITVPLLNWSDTLRRLGAKTTEEPGSTRTVIVYWGFLVTVGLLCVIVSYKDVNVSVDEFTFSNEGQDPAWGEFILTAEFILENNCADPCTASNPSDGGALFRSNKDLELPSTNQVNTLLRTGHSRAQHRRQAIFDKYLTIALFIFPYIILQGIWTALFGRRSPHQIRDSVYLRICELKVGHTDRGNQRRQRIAQVLGTLTYISALIIAVLCPILFILSIIVNELNLSDLPQGETYSHIGQWSPWAATAQILIAVAISLFHRDMEDGLFKIANQTFYRIDHVVHRAERHCNQSHSKDPTDTEVGDRSHAHRRKSTAPHPHIPRRMFSYIREMIRLHVVEPAKKRLGSVRKRIREEYKNEVSFWRDPNSVPWHTNRHGDVVLHRPDCVLRPRYIQRGDVNTLPATHARNHERLDLSLLPGSNKIREPLERLGISQKIHGAKVSYVDIPTTISPDNVSIRKGQPSVESQTPTGPSTTPTDTSLTQASAFSTQPHQRSFSPTSPGLSPHAQASTSPAPVSPASAAGYMTAFASPTSSFVPSVNGGQSSEPTPTDHFALHNRKPALPSSALSTTSVNAARTDRIHPRVSYLQVQHRDSETFSDTVTLKRDENGVYRIMEQ